MVTDVMAIVEPFVRRGVFQSPEAAVSEMARDYTLRQIERYRMIADTFRVKYGMDYEQFDAYLKARSATLASSPNEVLNRAVMEEEEDAFDWKVAREMLSNWLGLQVKVGV